MLQNKPRQLNKRYNDSGYTMIETMIAITVFAIGFLAVTSLQMAASIKNRSGTEATEAVTIATDRMERLMILPFDDPDLDAAANPHLENQGKYDIQWVVTDTDLSGDGINDAKIVNMAVSWDQIANTADRTVNLDFIKPDM